MKKYLLFISVYLSSFTCAGQSSKERAFVNTVRQVINLLSKRDSAGLSKYIEQHTGVYILYTIGIPPTYSHFKTIGFSDSTYPYMPFYDGIRYTRLHYSKLPVYDCEKWSKMGIFTDTTVTDHFLSKTAKALLKSGSKDTSAKEILFFSNLEAKSRRVVVADNSDNPLIFYLSYLHNKWYLTILDKATCDCSV